MLGSFIVAKLFLRFSKFFWGSCTQTAPTPTLPPPYRQEPLEHATCLTEKCWPTALLGRNLVLEENCRKPWLYGIKETKLLWDLFEYEYFPLTVSKPRTYSELLVQNGYTLVCGYTLSRFCILSKPYYSRGSPRCFFRLFLRDDSIRYWLQSFSTVSKLNTALSWLQFPLKFAWQLKYRVTFAFKFYFCSQVPGLFRKRLYRGTVYTAYCRQYVRHVTSSAKSASLFWVQDFVFVSNSHGHFFPDPEGDSLRELWQYES